MTQTRTVEVPVEVVKPLPAAYTDPIEYPAPLGAEITVSALVDQLFDAYDVIDRCNADRESARMIGR